MYTVDAAGERVPRANLISINGRRGPKKIISVPDSIRSKAFPFAGRSISKMRITCLLPSSLGDFILTTPSLKSLQNQFPRDEITWILPDSLLEASRLFPLTANRLTPLMPTAVATPDITVCFPPATRYYVSARRVGGRKRIGYAHEKMLIPRIVSRICLTQYWVCPSDSRLHELEAYGKILSLIDVPFEPTLPAPQVPREIFPKNQNAAPFPENKKTIAIHLGTRWTENPLPRLRKLAAANPDIHILALFSQAEAPAAKQMVREAGLPNLTAPKPGALSEILTFLKRSSFLIGVDGGLIHLAAAAGIPTLVYYPPDHFDVRVARWHPWKTPYQALPLSRDTIRRLPEFIENFLKRIQSEAYLGC